MRYGLIDTSWSITEANTGLALDLDKTLIHLKSHSHRDDELVQDWIRAATAYFFEQTGRSPLVQTFEYRLDQCPVSTQTKIELPFPPLKSVVSVKYVDANGDEQDVTDGGSPAVASWEAYGVDGGDFAGRGGIQLLYGAVWPTPQIIPGAVRIKFRAGYAEDADSMPALVQTVLRQIVGDFDRFRQNSYVPTGTAPAAVPLGVETLMRGFKYSALQTIVPRSCL